MTNLELPPVQAYFGMHCNAGRPLGLPAPWDLQDRNLCICGRMDGEIEIKWTHTIVTSYQSRIQERTLATNCKTK